MAQRDTLARVDDVDRRHHIKLSEMVGERSKFDFNLVEWDGK